MKVRYKPSFVSRGRFIPESRWK